MIWLIILAAVAFVVIAKYAILKLFVVLVRLMFAPSLALRGR